MAWAPIGPTEEESEAEEEDEEAARRRSLMIAEWSEEHAKELMQQEPMLEGLQDGMHVVPLGNPARSSLHHLVWAAPASEIAAAALSSDRQATSSPALSQGLLTAAWEHRHKQVRHQDCKPLKTDKKARC